MLAEPALLSSTRPKFRKELGDKQSYLRKKSILYNSITAPQI